jgi:hypothetical protein
MITSLVSSIVLPLYFLSFFDLCLKKIEDTNGGIIRHRSKKDRKYNGKKIEDTNGES